ncbi:MAG: adenylate/guanylate cyclase domain-containing protein [Thermodesulfobacteriota bacterium]|jgi:class 3 adenylate cyclase|nr:MAG: adenylate/guanylate cyclase domain-containing protein [Thermodesulfobacteriota bacterium]
MKQRYIYDPLTQKLAKIHEKTGGDNVSGCSPDENNIEIRDEKNPLINNVQNDTNTAQGWSENKQEEELSASEEEEMPSYKVTPLLFKNPGDGTESPHEKRGKYGRITEIGYPAYMVNRRWELEWINQSAEELLFADNLKNLPTAEERNIFRLLVKALPKTALTLPKTALLNLEEFISLNAEVASHDIPSPLDNSTLRSLSQAELSLLSNLWRKKESRQKTPIEKREFVLNHHLEGGKKYNFISCVFREGTLLILIPVNVLLDPIMDLLLGREKIVRDLMLNKMPSFCSLCVLVADLQNSVKISADLPPAEYFELVSEIWSRMENSFRKYHGTMGKHVGDGLVRFFLAEPESPFQHVLNGLLCAYEIRKKLAEINSEWNIKKQWTNRLCFNIGIHEGREWFGYIPVNQFTALGDTVNFAGRLSEFARDGAIWTSKHLISLLPPDIQKKLVFGIRRSSPQGELFVANTFSRIMDLTDLSRPENGKFVDISNLSVTELMEVDQRIIGDYGVGTIKN